MKKDISFLKKDIIEIKEQMKEVEKSKKKYTLRDWTYEEIDSYIIGYYKKILDENYNHSPELVEKIESTYFPDAKTVAREELSRERCIESISEYVKKGIFTEGENKRLIELANQDAILKHIEWR